VAGEAARSQLAHQPDPVAVAREIGGDDEGVGCLARGDGVERLRAGAGGELRRIQLTKAAAPSERGFRSWGDEADPGLARECGDGFTEAERLRGILPPGQLVMGGAGAHQSAEVIVRPCAQHREPRLLAWCAVDHQHRNGAGFGIGL